MDLIGGQVVAIDGAFLHANASKNQLLMKKTLEKDIKRLDGKITKYIESLTKGDKIEGKIQAMIEKKKTKKTDLDMLKEKELTQYNRTDPDAKLMVKPAHNLMAYNCQIAVDNRYKLIISTEVSSEGNDYGKIHDMATDIDTTFDINPIYLGDSGYYSGQEIAKCEAEKISVYVPIPKKQQKAKKKDHFTQDEFSYHEEADHFVCPNHEILPKSPSSNEKGNGSKHYFYRASSTSCKNCTIRDKCIPKKTAYKQLAISEHFHVVKKHHEKWIITA